uniref:Uncharacterized protein n=1 Tax=Plectus sambesii TaxID=2011161 RepID=A0A914VZB2_9BILA
KAGQGCPRGEQKTVERVFFKELVFANDLTISDDKNTQL